MRDRKILLPVLLVSALWIGTAGADAVLSGPGCVVDGNRLQVGGKVRDGKCWGGIDVRLHGSVAPSLTDTCKDSGGNTWECGAEAKKFLAGMMRQRSLSCYHIDGEFDGGVPVVTCISGRRDLALEMVTRGMAKALHDQSNRYALEEKDAKEAKRGIWK